MPPGKQRKFSGKWADAEKYGITITSIAAYEANGDILFNHETNSTAQYVDNYGIYGETQFSTNAGFQDMTIPLGSEESDLEHNGYWVFIRVYRSEVTDDNTWQEFLNQGLLPLVEERNLNWKNEFTDYERVPTALEASYFCRENTNRWWGWGAFENPLCALNASGKVFEIIYRRMVEKGNIFTPKPTESDYDQQFSVPTTNGGLWANPTSEYMTVCPTEGNDIVRITGYWPEAGALPNTIYMDYMAVDLWDTTTQDAAPYMDKRFTDPSLAVSSALWDTASELHTGTQYEVYVTSSWVTEADILAVTGLDALKGPHLKWDADTSKERPTDRCVAIRIIDTDPSKSLATVDKNQSREDRMADCKQLLGKVYPTAEFCSSSAGENSCSFENERLLNIVV